VAELFGDEVFPGQVILDASGNRVASSTTMFPIIGQEGAPSTRCVPSPSRSICSAYRTSSWFTIRIVVTTSQPTALSTHSEHEHHADISALYERGDICIEDYEASLKRDTALIRSHAGTPRHVNIFGYFYDIDTCTLTEVVTDKAEAALRA
jgi:carbonic anhydrase